MNVWLVDLDGTLSRDLSGVPYPQRPAHDDVVAAVKRVAERGERVVVFTARGMRTHGGDREAVERHVRPDVEAWLQRQGVPYHDVITGKPWCGPAGFYVDDRALHPEEFAFRMAGPLAGTRTRLQAAPGLDLARVSRVGRWIEVADEGATHVMAVFRDDPGPGAWFAAHAQKIPAGVAALAGEGWAWVPIEESSESEAALRDRVVALGGWVCG